MESTVKHEVAMVILVLAGMGIFWFAVGVGVGFFCKGA